VYVVPPAPPPTQGEEAAKHKARVQLISGSVLASLVSAYPYEVPPHVPPALAVLARLIHSPASALQEVGR
jgi:hypothetical protein